MTRWLTCEHSLTSVPDARSAERFYREVHTRSGVRKFVVESLGLSRSIGLSAEQTENLFRDYDRLSYAYAAIAVQEWMGTEAAIVSRGGSLDDLSLYQKEKRRLAFSRYAGCMNKVEERSGKSWYVSSCLRC